MAIDDASTLDPNVPLPADEDSLARVLGRLDDKIALLAQINQSLDTLARAIFKSWFVDFDPIRAKIDGRHTALAPAIATLFPSRLVDSELGEIPPGWRIGNPTDFAALKALNDGHTEFVYFAVTPTDTLEELMDLANRAAYPSVPPEIIAATKVVCPPDDLLAAYSRIITPLLAKMTCNKDDSQHLTRLRNALLPNHR